MRFYSIKTKKGVELALTSATRKSKNGYIVGWVTASGIFFENKEAIDEYIKNN